MSGIDALRGARAVFWDFDGVVKESVDVKTEAFVRLFQHHGEGVASRVRAHHVANGGMSRFDKFPLYLQFAGERVSQERVGALCVDFGNLVKRAVIEAPWVPGVERYLRRNPHRQWFALLSATPHAELVEIADALDLTGSFEAVIGAPTTKRDAIQRLVRERGFPPSACLMVGDATADQEAASAAGIPFLLRRHAGNAALFPGDQSPSVDDFTSA